MRTEHAAQALQAFHEDEDGMETLQVVMLVAVAALILIFIRARWEQIKGWVSGVLGNILGWTSES